MKEYISTRLLLPTLPHAGYVTKLKKKLLAPVAKPSAFPSSIQYAVPRDFDYALETE